jgi:hypothetical protein
MPPRYAYWTIIAGGLPTAFRAADREELLPTFQRIKEKHPDAQMKWFARGKLWESPEAARAVDRRGGTQGRARLDEAGRESQRRSREWRPGGEHRDPRQKFVDAKKERNAALRKDRWDRKNKPPSTRPAGPRDQAGPRAQGSGIRAGQGDRPQGNRPQGDRPHGDRPQGDRPHGGRPPGSKPPGKPPYGDRRPPDRKPFGARPWERKPFRAQGTDEPDQPPRPRGPNREPRPSETPRPTPPPRPNEPTVPPPGPSEQGRKPPPRRPFQPRGKFPKGPRR